MENVEYVYTEGIDEDEIEDLLRERGHGVLSLARDDEAYAVPIHYYYDGSTVLMRLSEEDHSTKISFAERTATATLVVYRVLEDDSSWSVMVRGPLVRVGATDDGPWSETFINEHFPNFRLFDETVPEVAMVMYELTPAEMTGRRTVE